ncbi:SMI1/KNR4 family protein [Actibacterium atlanticum]|uniref:SMI1/KNR4 family protein n=1 Tax=Actibacterium atlanticum TaxID=1461693 RepID=UPI0009DFD38C|nr:SMI1/KNR4 family protein [Actibacterium atlanticum]
MTEVFEKFARKWCHPDHPPQRVVQADVERQEYSLGVSLPADYKSALTQVGCLSPTLALITALVDRRRSLADLSELYSPDGVMEQSEGWKEAGLPETLICIAGDSNGNQFCFDRRRVGSHGVVSGSVYLWDHETGEISEIAKSFTRWVSKYVGIWSVGRNWKDV